MTDSSQALKKNDVLEKRDNAKNSMRKQLIVCGDSLLNNIEDNGLSNKKVKCIVRNYPRADSKDTSYLRPILIKNDLNT